MEEEILRRLSTTTDEHTNTDVDPEEEEIDVEPYDAYAEDDDSQIPVKQQQTPKIKKTSGGEDIIKIPNNREEVEFVFSFPTDGMSHTLAVGVETRCVTLENDSINILCPDALKLSIPRLVPFVLRYKNVSYTCIFIGKMKIDNFFFLALARVNDQTM